MRCSKLLRLCIFATYTVAMFGERKPVTLDSLNEYRSRARQAPGDPLWAPDGKTFAYRYGKKLMLYDLGSRKSREIVTLDGLDSQAVSPPAAPRFEWENRHVDEASLQWDSSGRELLYSSNGDLFLIDVPGRKWKQITRTSAAEHDAKLSPDGKQVAFRRGWDLYALDLASGRETALTSGGSESLRNGGLDWVYPEELDLDTAYWWSPDSKSIAYLQFDLTGEPLYPHEDLTRSRPVYEPQRYPQAGDKNAQVRIAIASAAGGESKWIDLGDTVNSYLIPRAGWLPDSSGVWVVRTNRVQNELEFLRFNTSDLKQSTVYRESDPYWINVDGNPVFLKNGREFLWTSERDGSRHIYLYALDGAAPRQLTKGSWQVSGIVGVDESARKIYYTSNESSAIERQLYSVDLPEKASSASATQPAHRRISVGDGWHRIVMAPGGGHYLDVYSNLTTPLEATLRSIDGAAIEVYRPADRTPLEEFDLRPAEIVEFKGPSGVTLYGSLIKPPGFDPSKKYPVIVNVYGGPHVRLVRNAWPGVTDDQIYAHLGYLVWQMDGRGSSDRGHGFETPIYHNLGAVELEDQRAGIEHLISMGIADPHRIGVTGWSYGGFMTLNMMLNAPGLVQAGFAGAPVTNWLNYDTIYTERYMGLPAESADGYAATSLVSKAANLQGSLMIVHNLEDDNVLFQNTLQMANALESAGKQFQMLVYPQKSHGVSGLPARQMEAAEIAFFEKALKSEALH